MTLPPLPEQPRAFLCTKCGGHTCEGDIKQKYPACANCGYLGFADDIGYTTDQMQAYGQQCREAALKEAVELCNSHVEEIGGVRQTLGSFRPSVRRTAFRHDLCKSDQGVDEMTTPHKAMLIQARDALLSACGGRCNAEYNPCDYKEVADALTAAIDAPEPEPVAHIRQTYIVGLDGELLGIGEKKELRFGCGNDYAHCTPLYTHPPAVREPLSEDQIFDIAHANEALFDRLAIEYQSRYVIALFRAIEAALRAKP